jgi:hypothetical protein
MIKTPPTHVFDASEGTGFVYPDDPSKGQISILTADAWYHFRLSRAALQQLEREIAQSLRTAKPQPREASKAKSPSK